MLPVFTTSGGKAVLAARCHEIQTCLTDKSVPEFETIVEIGMAIRLALHIRGLPIIPYEVMKLVAAHYLGIPGIALERILKLLAEVEFVKLQTTGDTIERVFPKVPFYEDTYEMIGGFACERKRFSEPEQLAVALVDGLAQSPFNYDSLRSKIGAEVKLFQRGIQIGTQGGYIIKRRCRGRDILLNPMYFSENPEIFADSVAKSGSHHVKALMDAINKCQGWPLGLIEKNACIGNVSLPPDQIKLLKRLAQDGMVRPPSIETSHAGENYFMFSPSPPALALNPTKRDVYEKALAIVSAVRQGQLLPKEYRIKYPGLLISKLRSELRIKASTEAAEQYRNLVVLRVGRLIKVTSGWHSLEIIDNQENRQALDFAYELLQGGTPSGMEVDEDVKLIFQKDQKYVESLISRQKLQNQETIRLSPEQEEELETLLSLGGGN